MFSNLFDDFDLDIQKTIAINYSTNNDCITSPVLVVVRLQALVNQVGMAARRLNLMTAHPSGVLQVIANRNHFHATQQVAFSGS